MPICHKNPTVKFPKFEHYDLLSINIINNIVF